MVDSWYYVVGSLKIIIKCKNQFHLTCNIKVTFLTSTCNIKDSLLSSNDNRCGLLGRSSFFLRFRFGGIKYGNK